MFTDSQRKKIKYHLDGMEPEEALFPFGLLDDVLVCFMHYSNFQEAYSAWERKNRIVWDHLGILMVLRGEEIKYAYELDILIILLYLISLMGFIGCNIGAYIKNIMKRTLM